MRVRDVRVGYLLRFGPISHPEHPVHLCLFPVSSPELSIEAAVLDGLSDMGGVDLGGVGEIGDGASDSEDAIIGACAEVEIFHGVAEEVEGFFTESAVLFEQARLHGGVVVDAGMGAETFDLALSSGDDATPNGGRIFSGTLGCQFTEGK